MAKQGLSRLARVKRNTAAGKKNAARGGRSSGS
jgi:hypothetical protein